MPHPWEINWTIVERLGVGGQGVASLVQSRHTPGHRGVLKYLKNNANPQARARMRREVASLESLAVVGANVPRVLERNTGTTDEEVPGCELYLVMEYIAGLTLKKIVEERVRFTVDDAIKSTLTLCSTLEIAHKEGVIHRDIKPDNIVVRNMAEYDLVLVDYGLSFNADDDDLTETGETFRNKFVDLPETNTSTGNPRDPRSDITAVCAVLYYMLTGHRPGQLQDASGSLPHQRHQHTLRDAGVDESRIAQLNLVLDKGLAVRIDARFQDIDELKVRLQMLLSGIIDNPEIDPISLSSELAMQLNLQDSKTKIGNFRGQASQIIKSLVESLSKYFSAISHPFKITVSDRTRNIAENLKTANSVVGPMVVIVSIDQHKKERRRHYEIVYRDGQFLAVAENDPLAANPFDLMRHDSKSRVVNWTDIVWYAKEAIPFQEAIEADCRRWVSSAMTNLKDEILK